ncbi:tyrosine-type recombinase/integrase [Trujillonella humicola]|uniref:tyrosine-type recombinase/integrase n=1 Tax=Trujillonella humicola TaxID=3383699 RepID=UPI0039066B0E
MASISRLPNGKYRPRYRDEHGKEHARHFDRKVDAQRWLDEVTAAVVTGAYVDPGAGGQSFAEFYAEWSARQIWAPGTEAAMGLAARSTTFADVRMRALRRSHIEQWVKAMVTRGLAPGTVHTRANNVRAVLRGAVADRVIPRDPSEGVTLPRRRRAAAAMTLPTPAQVGTLLQSADDSFRTFVGLCAFAGLRLGEAAAVRVSDIDFLRRTLTVARQVQRTTGGGIDIRAPKYGSERQVYLAPSLVDLLAQHVAAYCPEGYWIFTGETGEPPHQNSIGYRWRTTLKSAGLAGVKLHDLRHFYASGLIASGCDVVTVQRALGHATATTTLNTYSHLWPTAEDRTRRAAEQLFADSCGFSADSATATSR